MYFSQNKRASERRANDEYLRRASFPSHPSAESQPTVSGAPVGNPPVPPPPQPEEAPVFPAAPSLAMVYAPKQAFANLYEPDVALSRGTLFAALDLPFEGRSVTRK